MADANERLLLPTHPAGGISFITNTFPEIYDVDR